jgi:hypothetical protein
VTPDLDTVADELYGLLREEFTAARNAAAKEARKQGDRRLAERISDLRRPSTAAWLANQLAREHPDEVRALVELGDGLRAAQQELQGEELRQLSRQRNRLVHGLVQQARSIARAAGHPASDAVTRELEDTFTAAANSSAAARELAAGRLTSALDPADVGTIAGTATGSAEPSAPPRPGADATERLRRDLERARAEAADADAERESTTRALADAERAGEDAARRVRDLRDEIEAAERDEREARQRTRFAQRGADAADRAAREAQRRVCDLERRLADR